MDHQPWSPGIGKRFPWLAFGAMMGSFSALAVCVVLLVLSNGQPVTSWTVQPSVYLAIAVPVVNLLLSDSLSQGADIAWWRKSMKSGTTVRDLHHYWNYGRSFKEAILAGKRTNIITIACILATVTQINNPLLQRATRIVEKTHVARASVTLLAAPYMPSGYNTGFVDGRNVLPALFTPEYSSVVFEFYTGRPIRLPNNHGCAGTCKFRMKALGFAVNCSTYSMPFDLRPRLDGNGVWNGSNDPSTEGTEVFQSHLTWSYAIPLLTRIGTLFKEDYACFGNFSGQTCDLSPATVEYPVVIDGPSNTIAIDPSTSIWDDNILNRTTAGPQFFPAPGVYAGIYLALKNKYESDAYMNFGGGVGYILSTTGTIATQYAIQNITVSDPKDENALCRPAFGNPMNEMLAAARELTFRTSLAIPQQNTTFAVQQKIEAEQTGKSAVFYSDYTYLACALAITLIAMIAVVFVFRGYSELGRPVTLSPIETAKAFGAPLLKSRDSNAPVEKLIDELGSQSVRYGAVQVRRETQSGSNSRWEIPTKNNEQQQVDVEEVTEAVNVTKLSMADEDLISDPRSGQIFVG